MSRYETPVVVVADSSAEFFDSACCQLESEGYELRWASERQELDAQLTRDRIDLVLLDQGFHPTGGHDLLAELSYRRVSTPVILLSDRPSIGCAVKATKLGACDYLVKPPDWAYLRRSASRAINSFQLQNRMQGFHTSAKADSFSPPILGDDPSIGQVRRTIAEVAATDAKILVLGESGTGKELVARAIHHQSLRRHGPFIPVNMAALPTNLAESDLFGHEKGSFTGADYTRRGYCELAHKGTLFLDEIGEMDIALQAKLLRFLEEQLYRRVGAGELRKVNTRIVAATNRDPAQLVCEGKLREDLYYRLNVVPILVPPLRQRCGDIPLLAHWFLERAVRDNDKRVTGFTEAALDAMQNYPWPGNVRQLQNVVSRLVILARNCQIDVDVLPPEINSHGGRSIAPPTYRVWPREQSDTLRPMDQIEKQAILEALARAHGNVVDAAQLLGVGQATVYRKIKRYGIELGRRRPSTRTATSCSG
ncbi:MAG: sigma-54 dependent transcriptional regulator [Pirellulales bacterium]